MLTDEEYREKAGEAIFEGKDLPAIDDEEKPEIPEEIEKKEEIEEKPEIDQNVIAPVEDPFQGRWDKLTEQLSQFDSRIKETVGRVGAIQSMLDSTAKEAKEEKDSAPTEEEIAIAAKNSETWTGLKEDFPDWAEAIDARFAAERAGYPDIDKLSKQIREETVAEVKTAFTEEFEGKMNETVSQTNERLVTAFHPDWQSKIKTDKFTQWFNSQDQAEQAKFYSDDPVQAISLLDSFEESHSEKTVAEIKAERQENLDKATKVKSKTTTTTRQKAEDDMTDDEYRAKVAEEP